MNTLRFFFVLLVIYLFSCNKATKHIYYEQSSGKIKKNQPDNDRETKYIHNKDDEKSKKNPQPQPNDPNKTKNQKIDFSKELPNVEGIIAAINELRQTAGVEANATWNPSAAKVAYGYARQIETEKRCDTLWSTKPSPHNPNLRLYGEIMAKGGNKQGSSAVAAWEGEKSLYDHWKQAGNLKACTKVTWSCNGTLERQIKNNCSCGHYAALVEKSSFGCAVACGRYWICNF